ncbi:hypothetical protein PFISCL1PPCAC_4620 [Pristionchus fissidentatus]|uniref:EF-hand domain-containing protein n=1 Tax=Pristionchus fissidentatus TaxID=1538716 RepID=A0AAV5V2Q0_9BILA|nr:hypothetical protein PFISCL1PPCAC_4620 [Pristionchus fissidentatus]
MADRELASKLAQRAHAIGDEQTPPPPSIPPPPVPADPPKEIHENPYVPSDSAFSMDDLVRETLEQNNNSAKAAPAPAPPPLPVKAPAPSGAHPPMVPLVDAPRPESPVPFSKQPLVRIGKSESVPAPRPSTPTAERRGLPPMVPLVEPERPESPVPVSKQPQVRLQKGSAAPAPLSPPASPAPPLPASRAPAGAPPMVPLVDEARPESPVPTSKQPVVRVERGTNLPTTPVQKQKFVMNPGDGGAELEKRLEAQRQKKASGAPPVPNFDPLMREIERLERSDVPPALPQTAPPFIPGVSTLPPPPPFKPPPVPGADAAPEVTAPAPDTDAPPPPPPPVFEAPPPPPPSLITAAAVDQTTPPVAESAHLPSEECASKRPTTPPPSCSVSPPPPPPPPKSVCAPSDMVVTTAPLTALDTNANGTAVASKASPASTCGSSDDSDELAAKLARRNMINEGETAPQMITKGLGTYNEFPEFTRKQIKYFTDTFKKYDEDRDNFIDFMELKRMMEKLGEPQTHVALKQIIKKVDEDQDGKVSLREFLLIFRYAAGGELGLSSEVFKQLADSIDVTKEGVHGAAEFFQAKIAEQSKLSAFEEEIRSEQEEKKREEEERKERRKKFLENKSLFH